MTIFLIVAFALYVVLATSVAQTARSNGRNRLQWFLAALAINPVIAQLLLLSRVSGSRLAGVGGWKNSPPSSCRQNTLSSPPP